MGVEELRVPVAEAVAQKRGLMSNFWKTVKDKKPPHFRSRVWSIP